MSVRTRRDTIETGGVLKTLPLQTAAEAEAALPGGLRDEVRVFHTEAAAFPVSSEVVGGKLNAAGRVVFRALYAQGDLTHVRAVEASGDFTRQLPLPSAANGAQFTLRCDVTSVSSRVFNGRLMFRADMILSADAEQSGQANVVSAIDEDNAQTLSRDITVQRVVGAGQAQGLIRGEFALSDVLQAGEPLLASAHVRVEDIIGGEDGRATVTGVLDIAACHASDMPGRPVVCTQHSMPFEQPVTLSGEAGDVLSAQAEVTDVAAAPQGDEQGRQLRVEVGLRVSLLSLREQPSQMVTDAFATSGGALTPVYADIAWRTDIINEQAAESARIQLLLPPDAPKIKTVLAAFVHPVLVGVTAQGGKLSADVLAQATLLYMTQDSGIPVSHAFEEPLRLIYSTQADAQDALALSASLVEASAVAGDRAEVRCVITLHASGSRYASAMAVTDCALGEEERGDGALALYITEPGDRLWDVMKRYRLSKEALAAFNADVADMAVDAPLEPGTRIIAYKR